MYKQEQIKPYEGTGDKGKLVEEMFDNIAPSTRRRCPRRALNTGRGLTIRYKKGRQAITPPLSGFIQLWQRRRPMTFPRK